LQEAEDMKKGAEAEARMLQDKQSELDAQRDAIMAQADAKADEFRRSIEHDARKEIAEKKQQWMKQIDNERETFLHDLRERSMDHFYKLAQRALTDLSDSRVEEKMAEKFALHLEKLDREKQHEIARECKRTGNVIVIRSRLELSTNIRRHLTRTIHEHIIDGADVIYEQVPDAPFGIELRAGGQRLAWGFESYFDELEGLARDSIGMVGANDGTPRE
jgi:F-type H+-transporting ATPase subunit b